MRPDGSLVDDFLLGGDDRVLHVLSAPSPAATSSLAIGRLLVDVPVRGSIGDLLIAACAFVAANLSLGLLISTAAKTQFQAMQMMVFILLPSILLSGFMFPFDGMPEVARYIGELLPNTHFIRLTRGIMLRDAPLGELLPDLYYLIGFTLVAMTIAAKRFTRRLD